MANNRFFPVVAYCGGIMTCSGKTGNSFFPIEIDSYGYCKPTSGNVKNITDRISSWSGGTASTVDINNNTDADAYIFVKDTSGISATTLHVFKTKCTPKMKCTYNSRSGDTKIINDSSNIWKKVVNSGDANTSIVVLGDMNLINSSEYRIGSYEESAIYTRFPSGGTNPYIQTVEFSFVNSIDNSGNTTDSAYILDNTLINDNLNKNHFIGEIEERHETNADARPYLDVYRDISGKTYYSGGTTANPLIAYVSGTTNCKPSQITNGACGFIKRVPQDMGDSTNKGMFEGCTDLVTCRIPCQVRRISESTFKGCTSLSSYTETPNWITHIESMAFTDCTSLKTATLGRYIKEIGGSAFSGCTSLSSIKWNDFNIYFQDYMFVSADSTCNLSRIENNAFFGCSALTDSYFSGDTYPGILFPNGIKEIGDNAFSGCTSLGVLHLNEVSGVGVSAFEDCVNLTNIFNIDNLKTIEVNSFKNVGISGGNGITIVDSELSSAQTINEHAFENVYFNYNGGYGSDEDGKITLSSCNSIGEYAFYNCQFSNDVTIFSRNCNNCNMYDYAFLNVRFNKHLTVNGPIGYYDTLSYQMSGTEIFENAEINGTVNINGDFVCYMAFESARFNQDVNFNGSGITLSMYAFKNCSFPNYYELNLSNVKEIGDYCFLDAMNVSSVTFSSCNIGISAFHGVSSINKVYFSGDCTVGQYAFMSIQSNSEVRIKKGAQVKIQNSFDGNNCVVHIDDYIYNAGGSIPEDVAFYNNNINGWQNIKICDENNNVIYSHGH